MAKKLTATIGSFPGGINSGIDPLLLLPGQASFSTNSTNRGDFYRQRPAYKNLTLQFDSDTTRGNFQQVTALFQGAAYYLQDDGSACLMLAVGGKLFKVTPSSTTALVTQVTLPDAGNSTSAVQNWLWQSERWLIWNDGVNLPIFWDGTYARRSQGSSGAAIAIVSEAAGLVIPAVGQILAGVGISSAYTGGLNVPVIIGSNGNFGEYVIVASGTGGTITVMDVTGSLLSPSGGLTEDRAIFSFSTLYQSRALNVDYLGSTVTNWNQIPASGSSPQSIVINGPFSVALQAYLPIVACEMNDSTVPHVAVGDKVTIGGNLCTVTNVAYTVDPPPFPGVTKTTVTSITVSPDATYTGAVTGAVVLLSTHLIQEGLSTVYGGNYTIASGCAGLPWAWRQNSPTGTIGGSLPAATNWQPIGANNFTIYTQKNWTGPASGRIELQGAIIQLISFSTNALTCQLLSAQSGAVVYNATPVSLTEIVKVLDIGESLTSAGIDSGSRSIGGVVVYPLIQPVANAVTASDVGRVLEFQDSNGNDNYIFITAVSAHVPPTTTEYTIDIKNVTGTPGGFINPGDSIYTLPEIPVSTIGVYGMGRNWVCLPDGRSFLGCDIVGSSSGTLFPYQFTDAVLRVSQNQQLAGGGTFRVPGAGAVIRAMHFVAALDASLGQGALQILTDDNVFSCNATTNLSEWASLTSPILTESLIGAGAVSQTSVTQENADLLFRSSDGAIRSMLLARLDFNRWGNTPISREVVRSISSDSRALLPFCSAITFNNRMLMLCQPTQRVRGATHAAAVSLNFDSVSSIQGKQPSVWESQWSLPNALRLVGGFFNGVRRAFAICLDSTFSNIELVEIQNDGEAKNDYTNQAIPWTVETNVLFGEPEHEYKRLSDGELYFRDLTENVTATVFYRADQSSTWTRWHGFTITVNPGDSGYRPRVGLGEPDGGSFDITNNRPTREGYSFQLKLEINGACTFVGARFTADIIPQPELTKPF